MQRRVERRFSLDRDVCSGVLAFAADGHLRACWGFQLARATPPMIAPTSRQLGGLGIELSDASANLNVLITGTSSGIGRLTALAVAQAGHYRSGCDQTGIGFLQRFRRSFRPTNI